MTAKAQASHLPVLLLIPGMLNSARIWSSLVPLLQGVADIRIADVTQQTSIAQMACDAWSLVEHVPVSQRLVVCGFSMGGYVALDLVGKNLIGKRPDNSWAIGLLNTSGSAETADGMLAREKTILAIERDFERVIKGIATFGMCKDSHANTALVDEVLAVMREAGAQAAVRQLRAIMSRDDQRALLSQIQAEALVISTKDDLVVPPAASQDLAASIPSARLEWIEAAGHMTPLEQPIRLANLLKTLL